MEFEPTLPLDQPDLLRVSAFQRYLEQVAPEDGEGAAMSGLAAFSPSLAQDLMRFEAQGRPTELLEVVAAALRHHLALVIHLQVDERVLPLTLYPGEHRFHSPLALEALLALRLSELQVLHVEPAREAQPPSHPLEGRREDLHPIAPLAWALAMRGGREHLLPEIEGPAAYRVAPGLELQGLDLSGTVYAAVRRLQTEAVNLRRLSDFPGFDRARAMRLLNALYLLGALIVSRSHPAAAGDTWFGGL